MRALTEGGAGPDVVIQCVGAAAQDEQAVAMAGAGRPRGLRRRDAGRHAACAAIEILWRELQLLGSRGFVPADIADAIDLYLAGRVRTDHLLDRVRPLAEANEALDDLREGRVLRSVLVP